MWLSESHFSIITYLAEIPKYNCLIKSAKFSKFNLICLTYENQSIFKLEFSLFNVDSKESSLNLIESILQKFS